MIEKKKLLKDIAYEKIKEKILRGGSENTSENLLVEELNMSRTPIREGLQKLQHEGFIKILPNQGIMIPNLSIKETNDIFDYRIAIETASLKQAVHLLNNDDFSNLADLIEKQKFAVEENDTFSFIKYDIEFHLYLLKVVGNELFIQGIENVSERLHRLSHRIRNNPQKLLMFIQEHIQIMDYLKSKQIELAVKELENHLNEGKIKMYGGM
ncbi:GntR family transcriptional regulator [Priestia megaterium]|nr:GntR family transcriptional regulator [Priestia megaterium]